MIVAIASGKGGTGKTTMATNLAWLAAKDGLDVAYLDCDVEAPNGGLFLGPVIRERFPVMVSVPKPHPSLCTGCGLCGEICEFGAIATVLNKVLVFAELCHGCGGCWRVCPMGALTESHRSIGIVERGSAGKLHFVQGLLDVGKALSPPVIKAVKAAAPEAALTIIDAPPGTSCPVIESVRDADYVLLVTEPTPFGLNDLRLAVEMVRALGRPFGVVINRCTKNEDCETRAWCHREQIPLLAEIPDDRRAAEAYSRGALVGKVFPAFAMLYANLLGQIQRAVQPAHAAQ